MLRWRSGHPSVETLERSLLGHLSEGELDQLADHIAACPECQLRLDETRQYIGVMKAALAKAPVPPQSDQRTIMAMRTWRSLLLILLVLVLVLV